MSTLELIYIMAAAALSFLGGMVLETFIDNKAIFELKEDIRALKAENERLKANPPKQTVEIIDRSGIEADKLFKPF